MDLQSNILFQSPELVVINKPSGAVVVPGRFHGRIVPVVSHELGALLNRKIFVVHRLDQGTTGVLLFAFTPKSHRFLCEQFESRDVEKTYLCLVQGKLENQTIDLPLFKIPSKKNKSVVSFEKGKPSQTEIQVLSCTEDYSLVQARPLTGRPHQIRVHLAHLKAPLIGDPLYGGPQEIKGSPVEFPLLHSWKVRLKGPDGKFIEVTAPIPEKFKAVAKSLGLTLP